MVHIGYIGLLLPLLFDVLYAEEPCYVYVSKGNYFEGSCAINIDKRPGFNHVYGALPDYNEKLEPKKPNETGIKVSRHHIIPFNVLRGFHNKMVESGQAEKFKKYFAAFNTLYRKFYEKKSKKDYKEKIENLERFVNGLSKNEMKYKSKGGSAEGFDSYEEFYVWLPGNLFVGPNNRTDDPDEGFEKGAKTIVGKEMFSHFKYANDEMQKYAEKGTADYNKLTNTLIKILNSRLEPYPLDKNQWTIDKGHKYSIKPSASLLTCAESENSEYEELQTTTFTTAIDE